MTSKQRVVFIGNPLPEAMIEQHQTMSFSIADNLAQLVMVKGLFEHYGDNLTVISELSSTHPETLELSDGIHAEVVSSSSRNRIVYYLSLLTNYTKKLNAVLKTMGDARDIVIVTKGPYIYVAIPVFIARLRRAVKWVPFIIATIEVPEYGFPLSIISKMSRWTVKKADGLITYVAKTAHDYLPGKPFVEIVYSIGTAQLEAYRAPRKALCEKFTIAYTGELSDVYNLGTIIGVIEATGDTYRWRFAGVGKYAPEFERLAQDSRYDVEYLGRVSNVEAIELQKTSHLLVCLKGWGGTRTNEYYSKYAASGKLAEYLCSGTPLIAGDIPAFSEKVRPFATFEKIQTVEKIVEDIAEIAADYPRRVEWAQAGQQYAFEHFTAEYQNARIYEFLESL